VGLAVTVRQSSRGVVLELDSSDDEMADGEGKSAGAAVAAAKSTATAAASSSSSAAAAPSVAAPSRSPSSFAAGPPRSGAAIRPRLSLSLYCPLLCLDAAAPLPPSERVGPHKLSYTQQIKGSSKKPTLKQWRQKALQAVAAATRAAAGSAAGAAALAAALAPSSGLLVRGLEELPTAALLRRRNEEIFRDRLALDKFVERQSAGLERDSAPLNRLFEKYDDDVVKLDTVRPPTRPGRWRCIALAVRSQCVVSGCEHLALG